MANSKVSRRTLLATGTAAVAAAALPGCGFETGAEATANTDDVSLVEHALHEEADFAATCESAKRAHRRLAARIDVVIAGQRTHVDALSAALEQPPTYSSMPVDTDPPLTAIPREAARLHERRLADCLAAQSGPLAQLFASIAASHAVTADQWRVAR